MTADRDRLLDGGAKLALVVGGVDARIDSSEVRRADRSPGGARIIGVTATRQRPVRPVTVGRLLRRHPEIGTDFGIPFGPKRLLQNYAAGVVRLVGPAEVEDLRLQRIRKMERLGRRGAPWR